MPEFIMRIHEKMFAGGDGGIPKQLKDMLGCFQMTTPTFKTPDNNRFA